MKPNGTFHSALCELIGYPFRNEKLLTQALTHSSYANEHKECEDYERLECLGDAVLEMISSACLFAKYPEKQEGELTRLRAALVCEPALAFCMRNFHLEDYVLLG